MKRNLNEVLNQAIINKEPAVIVEGKDDRILYERISEKAKVIVKFWQIEYIEDYSEGCTDVVKAIEKLQPKYLENNLNIKLIAGIIDKDVRPYTSNMPNLKGLFITKYYSIETYFATSNNLTKLLNAITYLSKNEIDTELVEYIETSHKQSLSDLFFISLEALKNACNPKYDAVVRYSEKESNVVKQDAKKDKMILPALESKRTELLSFAQELKLTEQDIKLICKGKWFLYNYIYFTLQSIENLANDCKNDKIKKCDACKIQKYQNCHYKTNYPYKPEQLEKQIKNIVDENECSDIINFLNSLNYKNN